ncbi:hypothetical protein PVAP13_3NG100471 [Panicum virgatum]|uniref:Benzyl alcohol O-benzoyltransferase n=1 Tax=Panicum virgatum TaxID=38727 RepID=A0A8T0UIY2_PANVG|nr:hypothetical protein PVAP13_3NG100471 [Panicum virgatum]
MACSSAAPKFLVRRRPAVLVAPAAPTPRELKRLSDFDEQVGLRFQISNLHFYRRDESMGGKDPAWVIREALANALVHYYPFAGRLREHDGCRLAVDCTGEGVLFVKADAEVGLEHFDNPLLPPFPCREELIFDVPGSSAILNTPLLLFQVTRLACGGFILGVRLNHTMADAQGLTQFLGAVAELARGAHAPSVLPVWKRELLEGRNQQQPALVHDKLGELPLHLQKRATKFDTISSWIWKFRNVALAPDPDGVMVPMVVVNARGRNTAGVGIPIGYYGNAFLCPVAISTAGELSTNPLSYAIELVKKAKNQVDMEYMRSTADLIVLRRGQSTRIIAGMYSLADARRARFQDLDFGWGKPLVSFLLPYKNTNGEDGIVVPMCLPGPAMDRLVEEMSKLLHQPHVFPVKRSAL